MTRIVNKLYGGKEEIVFNDYKHKYIHCDKVIPGATTILGILNKPALMYWAANMSSDYFLEHIEPGKSYDEMELEAIWKNAKKAHTQKKDYSASLGSKVHKWVEDYINGKDPGMPVNKDMQGAVERWLGWVDEHDIEFLLAEQFVFSKKYKYAGQADFICKIDGKLWLGDLKTSNAIYDSYFAQVGAYLEARVEEYPEEDYVGAVVVRVGKKDGDFEAVTKTKEELAPHFELFLNCLATYKSLKKIEDLSRGK
jgi:hypothetical protein